MNSFDFLKEELRVIADNFPSVHIKYGYNKTIETHIVELLPLIEYNQNSALDKAWIPVSLKFMELFEEEEIAFISSDSSLSLKDVVFEYNIINCTEENVFTEIFSSLTHKPLKYSFPTSIPNGVIIANNFFNFMKTPIDKNKDSVYNSDNSYLEAA